MDYIFPNANEARNLATDITLVFNEISLIQHEILTSIENKQYDAIISDTLMTGIDEIAMDYFEVWQRIKTDKVKFEQMNRVITYFSNNGYSIIRKINELTGNTFVWYIEF